MEWSDIIHPAFQQMRTLKSPYKVYILVDKAYSRKYSIRQTVKYMARIIAKKEITPGAIRYLWFVIHRYTQWHDPDLAFKKEDCSLRIPEVSASKNALPMLFKRFQTSRQSRNELPISKLAFGWVHSSEIPEIATIEKFKSMLHPALRMLERYSMEPEVYLLMTMAYAKGGPALQARAACAKHGFRLTAGAAKYLWEKMIDYDTVNRRLDLPAAERAYG